MPDAWAIDDGAALVIAGIGIGGGVASYLEARRTSIATLKVLGAKSADIIRIYALQIAAAAGGDDLEPGSESRPLRVVSRQVLEGVDKSLLGCVLGIL